MIAHDVIDIDPARAGQLHVQDEQARAGAHDRVDDERAIRHDDRLDRTVGAERLREDGRDVLVILGDDDRRLQRGTP
jgi:hypothetical protein